jgi:thiol:disulfide interchange protein DsbD
MKFRSLLFIVIAFLAYINLPAQDAPIVKIKPYLSQDKAIAGKEFKGVLKVDVNKEYHINSNKPYEDFLIPTNLTIDTTTGLKLQQVYYPAPHDIKLAFSETPLSVWESELYIGSTINVPADIKPGNYYVKFNLEYQACNNNTCTPPNTVTDSVLITVVNADTPIQQLNQDIFKNVSFGAAGPVVKVSQEQAASQDDWISGTLQKSGLLIGLLFVFIGGLALNLTPCVYPLIPITIGYFGGQSEGSTTRLTMMGLLFVVGLAITYSVVGVVTALSGSVFGSLLQNTIVLVIIALIFVVLSLSMFGVYEFKMPDALVAKAGGAKGGMYGAFFMGLTMGIVAAPCIGPFVLGLVTVVAAKGDPLYGFLLFFVLALGLGTPYFLLAIFSGKIKKLPRAGEWMEAVKHIFGFILLAMALYFIKPVLPSSFSGYVLPVFMIIAALWLLLFDKLANRIKGFFIFKVILSLLLIAVAVYALYPTKTASISWSHYNRAAIEASFKESKATIIDFYADWCIPCKELDASTFSDARVIKEAANFNAFKADMTKSLDPEVDRLRNDYNIRGVPTVLIIDKSGKEVQRITGFVNADEFLKIMKMAY